jgi:hypothetical protein
MFKQIDDLFLTHQKVHLSISLQPTNSQTFLQIFPPKLIQHLRPDEGGVAEEGPQRVPPQRHRPRMSACCRTEVRFVNCKKCFYILLIVGKKFKRVISLTEYES